MNYYYQGAEFTIRETIKSLSALIKKPDGIDCFKESILDHDIKALIEARTMMAMGHYDSELNESSND